MFKYDRISSENEEVILEGYKGQEDEVKPQWVSIEFTEVMNKEFPKQTLMWDNPAFIFGKFYKFLYRCDEGRNKKKDKENFSDIWDILTTELVKDMIEMLEEAIRLGWKQKETI